MLAGSDASTVAVCASPVARAIEAAGEIPSPIVKSPVGVFVITTVLPSTEAAQPALPVIAAARVDAVAPEAVTADPLVGVSVITQLSPAAGSDPSVTVRVERPGVGSTSVSPAGAIATKAVNPARSARVTRIVDVPAEDVGGVAVRIEAAPPGSTPGRAGHPGDDLAALAGGAGERDRPPVAGAHGRRDRDLASSSRRSPGSRTGVGVPVTAIVPAAGSAHGERDRGDRPEQRDRDVVPPKVTAGDRPCRVRKAVATSAWFAVVVVRPRVRAVDEERPELAGGGGAAELDRGPAEKEIAVGVVGLRDRRRRPGDGARRERVLDEPVDRDPLQVEATLVGDLNVGATSCRPGHRVAPDGVQQRLRTRRDVGEARRPASASTCSRGSGSPSVQTSPG